MTKAEIGDLIVFSASSRFASMTFGIVYGFNKNDVPMVRVRDVHWKTREKIIRKQEASVNYLVVSRKDDKMDEALAWWLAEQSD